MKTNNVVAFDDIPNMPHTCSKDYESEAPPEWATESVPDEDDPVMYVPEGMSAEDLKPDMFLSKKTASSERVNLFADSSADYPPISELTNVTTSTYSSRVGASRIKDFSPAGNTDEIDPWDGQICTLKNAYAPREHKKFLISNTIGEGDLMIMYGPPGEFKSCLAADMAFSIATGKPFMGRPSLQGNVLWVDIDNGRRRTDERMEAFGRGKEAGAELETLSYISIPNPPLNGKDSLSMKKMEKRLLDRHVCFVVIDNLGTLSMGAKENTDEMIGIMGHLRAMTEATGATILVIHHKRKTQSNDSSRAGESVRGHSSIEAAIDLAIMVNKDADGYASVKSTKTRDSAIEPFTAKFVYAWKEGTQELETAYFEEVEKESLGNNVRDIIIEYIKDNPGQSKKHLFSTLNRSNSPYGKISVNQARQTLEQVIDEGVVVTSNGIRGAICLHVSVDF